MPLIIIILLLGGWGIYGLVQANRKKAPAVKDWNKFNRDTIGMSAKEIKKGVYQGRW